LHRRHHPLHPQPITSKTFSVSLLVEFIGVMIFSFLGSTVDDKVWGPWCVAHVFRGCCQLLVLAAAAPDSHRMQPPLAPCRR
jgi:hypothetical protein